MQSIGNKKFITMHTKTVAKQNTLRTLCQYLQLNRGFSTVLQQYTGTGQRFYSRQLKICCAKGIQQVK